MADLYRDQYFEKSGTTAEDKAYLSGQLNVIDDIIGLPLILTMYKTKP